MNKVQLKSHFRHRLSENIALYIREGTLKSSVETESSNSKLADLMAAKKQEEQTKGSMWDSITPMLPMIAMMAMPKIMSSTGSVLTKAKNKVVEKISPQVRQAVVEGRLSSSVGTESSNSIMSDYIIRQKQQKEQQELANVKPGMLGMGGAEDMAIYMAGNQAISSAWSGGKALLGRGGAQAATTATQAATTTGTQAISQNAARTGMRQVTQQAVRQVGRQALTHGARIAAGTLTGAGAAAVGTAAAGAAVGLAGAYAINKSLDAELGYRENDGLVSKMWEWDTWNPISAIQGKMEEGEEERSQERYGKSTTEVQQDRVRNTINPDTLVGMKQDPRDHARLIRLGQMSKAESDRIKTNIDTDAHYARIEAANDKAAMSHLLPRNQSQIVDLNISNPPPPQSGIPGTKDDMVDYYYGRRSGTINPGKIDIQQTQTQ